MPTAKTVVQARKLEDRNSLRMVYSEIWTGIYRRGYARIDINKSAMCQAKTSFHSRQFSDIARARQWLALALCPFAGLFNLEATHRDIVGMARATWGEELDPRLAKFERMGTGLGRVWAG